jgi:hypothetical protein
MSRRSSHGRDSRLAGVKWWPPWQLTPFRRHYYTTVNSRIGHYIYIVDDTWADLRMALRVSSAHGPSLSDSLCIIVSIARDPNAASRVGALYVRRYLDLGRVDPAQTKPTHRPSASSPPCRRRRLTTTPSAHVTTPKALTTTPFARVPSTDRRASSHAARGSSRPF